MRLPAWSIIVIVIVIAGLFLIYIEPKTAPSHDQDQLIGQARPDFFMDEVSSLKLTPDGRFQYQLTATRLAHFADIQLTQLTNPHLVLYRENKLPWELKAEYGEISDIDNVILLKNDVVLVEKNDGIMNGTQLNTSELTIKPNENFAVTDKPVTIRFAQGKAEAVGMKAFLESSRFELLSEVHGVYHLK